MPNVTNIWCFGTYNKTLKAHCPYKLHLHHHTASLRKCYTVLDTAV